MQRIGAYHPTFFILSYSSVNWNEQSVNNSATVRLQNRQKASVSAETEAFFITFVQLKVLLFNFGNSQVQLIQLLLVDLRRACRHQLGSILNLREGDNVTQAVRPAHNH